MAATTRLRNEERARLTAQIDEWNSNRLDLFALSQPNENLEFFGVMRFFYQDEGEKVSTKCVRVSSTASTKDVMGILIEKFRPDLRMLSRANYALYEVHINGEERQLKDTERPLLVQLNWGKDDREGRFLLKRETDKTMLIDCTSTAANLAMAEDGQSFKRKLSKREKKELKKKEKEQKVKGKENDSGVAEKLYNELPESSFTRSISNPELVMRKRRQLKLEKKLQQIRSNDGGPDAGGTLKIYGSAVNPDVPYKTLLLSVTDTVAHVVKETLEKYGMEKEDPEKFCLIQVMIPPDGPDYGKDSRERVLDDDECPLAILLQHPSSKGTIMYQLRPRTADMPKRVQKKPIEGFRDEMMFHGHMQQQHQQQQLQQQQPPPQMPFLLQIITDGVDSYSPKKYLLTLNTTEIGRDRNSTNPKVPRIQLATQDILPLHCIMDNRQGVVSVTPMSKEALVFVNGTRVFDTTVLRHGMVVQFGKLHQYRFFDEPENEQKGRPGMPLESIQGPKGMNPRDFETTFDVDGRVETIRNQTGNERNYQQQQPMLGPDPRFGPPGYEADLLPASLSVRDEVEDKFLAAIINDDNLVNIQFRMAPTYVIYLAIRCHVLKWNRPDLSPSKLSQVVGSVTSRVAHLVLQKIRDSHLNPGLLSFWMANASEMLNFFKHDADVVPTCLQAQNVLAEAVQLAFNALVEYMQTELGQAMPAILNPKPDEPEQNADGGRHPPSSSTISSTLQVLSSAMTVLRRCRVNAALTIQLFSQLFHFINMWIFNRLVLEPQLHLCTSLWGQMLRRRLNQIEMWAEQQGLELAAECHLAKVLQATFLLESPKMPNDIGLIVSTCESLNSVQVHRILTNYIPGRGEPPLRQDVVEQLIYGARTTVDEMLRNEGIELRIDEPISLQLPFLLPDDGYSCEFVKGVPNGLPEFLMPFVQNGICRYTVNQNSKGTWMIYMTNQENVKAASQSDGDHPNPKGSDVPLRMEPEIFIISFNKVKNSLGLSIIAAKGEGQKEKCIYVKSVVPGGGAAMDGRIQAGDQLIEVDGKSLIGVSQEKAAEMMTQTGQVVTLKVAKQGAIFHGLATLLNQTQQPPNAQWTKQNKLQSGDGGKMPLKGDSSSQPSLTNNRPLSNDFRNSPKPLGQQLEAKSTPVLTDTRFREQVSGEVDVYPGNFRSSPQTSQNIRLDPMRQNSSSQPDLINRRPDINRDDINQPSNQSSGFPLERMEDQALYGTPMKGARSSPNISAETQKGYAKYQDPEHQRVLEWQQRNQMMAEHEQWEQKRVGSSIQDGPRFSSSAKEFPRAEFSESGRMAPPEDDRGRKIDVADVPKQQPVKPVLPFLPQQPVSKKGPGYATQMLFPGSAQGKSLSPKDTSSVQGYQSNQQPAYGAGKSQSQTNITSQGYGAVSSAQPSGQSGIYSGAGQSQAYTPSQSLNYPGNVQLQSGGGGGLVTSSAQQSEYRPISEFSRGHSAVSQASDGSWINPVIKKSTSSESDFPPPPSEMHLAQLGVNPSGSSSSFQPSSQASFYGQQTTASSVGFGKEKVDINTRSFDQGRFSQGERQASVSQVNHPAAVYGYQENVSGYLDRRGAEDTRTMQGLGNEDYRSRADSSSAFPQQPESRIPGPQAPVKKPPPIAAKPKVNPVGSVSASIDLKPYSAPSPWVDKEANEKRRDEEIQTKRLEEIKRLENRPYRSPEEQNKLQRLIMEAEFDRRANEATEEKESEEDGMENQAVLMRRMDDEFQNRQPIEKPLRQPEPMYAKVDKQHVLSDRNQGDFQPRAFPSSGDMDRKLEQQRPMEQQPLKNQDYSRSVSGPPVRPYEMTNQDRLMEQGNIRYPGDDRKPADLGDYSHTQYREPPRQMALGPVKQEAEVPRPMMMVTPPSLAPTQYNQADYPSSYVLPSKSASDVYNTSVQSSQSSSFSQQQQPPRTSTVSALKQPDSQASGGAKKSVTFNENIGVTEYTINRSYGSTSSESSFPQSPEQTRLPNDQPPPPPPPASYISAVRPGMSMTPVQQYAPPTQPSYLQQQQPRNTEPSYPYGASGAEPQYPYNSQQHMGGGIRPATSYKPQMQDQMQYQEASYYSSTDPRYPNQPGGAAGGYQQQYQVRQPLYSHQQDPMVYNRQQQMNPGEHGPNATYLSGPATTVIGAQEVYRDPRDKIMLSKAGPLYGSGSAPNNQNLAPDRMSFRDKMSMFASEGGE